jgi:hypothetical protein
MPQTLDKIISSVWSFIDLPNTKSIPLWFLKLVIIFGVFYLLGDIVPAVVGFFIIHFPFPWMIFVFACIVISCTGPILAFITKRLPRAVWYLSFVFSLLLIFIGFGSASLPPCFPLRPYGWPLVSSKVRLPLQQPFWITVDSTGLIYVIEQHVPRVQVYGPDGKFLRGWFVQVPVPSGLEIDDKDHLHIITSTGTNPVYDKYGRVLEVIKGPTWRDKCSSYFWSAQDRFGNTYKIRKCPFLYSAKIIKLSPSGEDSVAIADPFPLCFLAWPTPSIALAFLGVAMITLQFKFKTDVALKIKNKLEPYVSRFQDTHADNSSKDVK